MFKRQTTGSVVCASCGYLVGVRDETCYHCGRRNPGLWGFGPALRSLGHDLGFMPFVIGLCVLVYALTLLATGGLSRGGGLPFSPSSYALLVYGAAGSIPVFELKRWWTLLSAGWLHGSVIHLAMDIWGIRVLAPIIADLYGPGRLVIIYTASTVAGFLLSSTAGLLLARVPIALPFGAPLTVGASAAIFGLMGATLFYGHRTGSGHVSSQAWSWAIPNVVLGFVLPGIDNAAHVGGFLGGYLVARLLDPLKPERVQHMFWAVICLALSLLSIAASVITGLRLR